jgi:hypothetical protein
MDPPQDITFDARCQRTEEASSVTVGEVIFLLTLFAVGVVLGLAATDVMRAVS